MKRSFPIFLAAFGVLALYLLKKINMASNLSYSIKAIDIDGSILKPTIKLTLNVENKVNASATINSINGRIYINNVFFGKIDQNVDQKIDPVSISDILIIIDTSLGSVFDLIDSVKNSTNKNVDLKFDGYLRADNINLPLNFSYAF
jgi:hypothetical protein